MKAKGSHFEPKWIFDRFVLQIACIGPLIYSIAHKCTKLNIPAAPVIFVMLLFCCMCTALMAFFWHVTVFIFNQQRSIALIILLFGLYSFLTFLFFFYFNFDRWEYLANDTAWSVEAHRKRSMIRSGLWYHFFSEERGGCLAKRSYIESFRLLDDSLVVKRWNFHLLRTLNSSKIIYLYHVASLIGKLK